jgi:hypothetical protein
MACLLLDDAAPWQVRRRSTRGDSSPSPATNPANIFANAYREVHGKIMGWCQRTEPTAFVHPRQPRLVALYQFAPEPEFSRSVK